ncbi:MAG: YcxB family protein [Ferruginibacter sp.]
MLDIQITKTEYIEFLKYYYFKRNLVTRLILPVGLTLLFSNNISRGTHNFQVQFLFYFLIVGIIFYSFFFLIPYLIAAKRLSKQFDRENIDYQLLESEEGIKLTTANKESFAYWKEIKSINSYNNFIYLILFSNKIILVPKSVFQFSNEYKIFLKSTEKEILAARAKGPNHLYAKGWLGLIPLFGGFVGIWLITQGAFKYKDRKLILIGVAALTFTVLIYGSLIYFTKDKLNNKDLYISSRQMYMNSLVRNIEFYKVQQGEYPDSLPQLLTQAENNSNHPPLFYSKDGPLNAELYYKKINAHYTLFFSGPDRIPYTEDDVLPQINTLDIPTGFVKSTQ